MRTFELGERLEGTMNARYEHTIGLPVCNKTLPMLLREELDEYLCRYPHPHGALSADRASCRVLRALGNRVRHALCAPAC
jgi:hypothetical protein